MKKCAKCRTDCKKEGTIFIEGCNPRYFCMLCSSVLENIGSGNIQNFINDEKLEMIENPVMKNMIEARINRSLTKSKK